LDLDQDEDQKNYVLTRSGSDLGERNAERGGGKEGKIKKLKKPHPFLFSEVISSMKTNIRNYRGGVTLGLLAISLFNLNPRLLAQKCQEDGTMNRWEKRFDANQDGKLDAQETAVKEAARKDAFKRLQGQYDKDGDGKLSEGEKAARRTAMEAKRKEMIAKFDKDGDGRLNSQEREAAKAAHKTEKEAGQTKKG